MVVFLLGEVLNFIYQRPDRTQPGEKNRRKIPFPFFFPRSFVFFFFNFLSSTYVPSMRHMRVCMCVCVRGVSLVLLQIIVREIEGDLRR